MKLVVTDGYTINPGDLSWEPLKEFGELVVFDHSPRDEDEMIRRIGDADILVANKAKVSRRVIDACPNLKFITIQAAGYDAIDYQYAKEKGIPLSNVPDYGSAAWPSTPLPCCWKSAAVWATMWRPCGRAAGPRAGNGASGTTP